MSKSKFTNFPNLLFSVFSFGNGKNLREPTLQNPSSEKINRKLVKSPSVSLRVSPTPYALESIFKTSLTSMMFFKKVLQFTSFQIMMYYLDVFSSSGITGVFNRGLIGRIFKRICIWGFIVQKCQFHMYNAYAIWFMLPIQTADAWKYEHSGKGRSSDI